jgi:hypothetical protein
MGRVWLLYPSKTNLDYFFISSGVHTENFNCYLFMSFSVEVFTLGNNLIQDSPGARLLGEHQFSGGK